MGEGGGGGAKKVWGSPRKSGKVLGNDKVTAFTFIVSQSSRSIRMKSGVLVGHYRAHELDVISVSSISCQHR